ncbi:MAG: alpha/beta fold hydrolase [Acidimicrobiia bacterium]
MASVARTVVILHGAAGSAASWDGVAEAVRASGVPCVVPDLPAHGSSGEPALRSIGEFADWVEGLIEDEGLDGIVLAGHSMGSLIALDIAGRRNTRLAAVTLMCVGHPMSVSATLLDMAASDGDAARSFMAKYSASKRTSPELEARREAHRLLMDRVPRAVIEADLHACNGYDAAVAAARAVSVPAIVVTGTEDRMVPAAATAPIVEALESPLCRSLDGVGHAINIEAPGEVAAILTETAENSSLL